MAVSGSFLPLYPTPEHSYTAGAAISAGKLVATGTSPKVATAASASRKVVGVAAQTASADGDRIGVYDVGGIFVLKAKGAVSAGDQLMASTDNLGDVSVLAYDVTATVNETTVEAAIAAQLGCIGRALEDIADGATGRVRIF